MSELGDAVRNRRIELRWSQWDLAKKAGPPATQQIVARIELGKTLWSRALPPILAALDLDPSLAGEPLAAPISEMGHEIPIFAIREDDHWFELTSLFAGATKRPAALNGVSGAYAIYMRGNSMSPMYRSGDLLVVNPQQPPRPEGGALFLAKDRTKCVIAEFVRESSTEWTVKRWGDAPAELKLKKQDFPICESVYTIQKGP